MNVEWRKSSHSGGVHDETCVEVAALASWVGVRDSKNVGVGYLSLTPGQFASLRARIVRAC
ncbi:uncharacterized protein DUF397 [Actinocorallia herbida]|uniref:Uncharacterized protein DUF397 n=1 Tax=Actinocorallia herbida TaxID=58109 RepID=A0A3N1CUU2_9ACTN|nr:DUF397 domain-containing protein [Actinocorallia herbida]ROO85037.1 uncharacterized protein DUF397 [Actinocorallia herbida]